MTSKLFRFIVLFSVVTLVACKAALSPEWTLFYTHAKNDETRLEWLSNVAVDAFGDLLSAGETIQTGSNRQQNVLLVKHDSAGNLIWATEYDFAQGAYRSDDKTTDMALDSDGNAYLTGVQYIVENEVQRYGSFLLKVDRFGEVLWVQSISDKEDARDVEVVNGKVYVTGHATQVFDIDGARLLNIPHPEAKAWDVEVDDLGNIFVVGYAAATKYSAEGVRQWSVAQPEGLSHQASVAVNHDGSLTIAHTTSTNAVRIAGITANGTASWDKTYLPPQQSYGLPGHALVKADWRGDIMLAVSNDKGRRLVKLSSSGQQQWQATSSGIVKDFTIGSDGAVYVVGGGSNEKYDANGNFIAEATVSPTTQITTGAIALDGNDIYVGYSANNSGGFQFFLSKYIDQ
ncbi:hypothetical protein [Alkalimarinus coralli]|uniref:hypothetical protein n=1 Tax=Alkalimarinus coralli TaxID=2935863 RepID=UPI00202AFA2E|nr:hypothetical protein [Alkalimarinus coralli]